MGFDRDRGQSGDWRRGLRAAVTLRCQRRRLESVAGRGRGAGIDAHRAVLCRGEQPIRRHRRSLPVHASRVWPVRRLRGGVDAVVHPCRELGGGHQRARHCGRILRAGPGIWLAARGLHCFNHRRDRGDQHPGDPPEQPGAQRADGGEAAPARGLRRGRDLLRRLGAARARPRAHICRAVVDWTAAGICVWRIRGDSSAGGRSARPTTRGAVCPGHDDRHRHASS